MFWAYKINEPGMWDRAGEMEYCDVLLLADLIKRKRGVSSLIESEKGLWNRIDGRFAHRENDRVIPDVLVFEKDAKARFHACIQRQADYPAAAALYDSAFAAVLANLKTRSNAVLHQQLPYYVSRLFTYTRGIGVNEMVKNRFLSIPEDLEKSTVAMYMEMR